VSFQRPGGFLTPTFNGAAASSKTWRLTLPSRSTDAFRIEETASGVALSPRLLGARPADAEPAGGYVVYRGASAEGGTFLHRITGDGTEDYITFDREPAAKQVVYSVDLSPAVAGLRLVGGTLEAVDGSGTPRLRVASPYLVGADGQVVEAALDVAGCNVDTSPGEPWDRPTVAPGASTCQVRVSWEGAQVAYPAVLDPSWSTTASMSRTRWQAATSTLPNGRVLVSGGETTGNITTRTAEIYDTTSRTWATTASMSTARQQHRSVRIANGTVMVTGGIDEATFTVWATTEAYNQTSGTWSALATMPNARRDHTMTLLANSDILVTGGTVGQVPQTRSEIYNHNNNTWAATTNMLVGQEKHTATLLNNGNVLVVGFNAPGGQLFNTSSATWTSTPGLAVPRQSHTATLLTDGTVLIAGGDGTDPVFGGGFGSVRAAEIFNPTTGSWTRTASAPAPCCWSARTIRALPAPLRRSSTPPGAPGRWRRPSPPRAGATSRGT
jgi:hypothetical protein